MLTNKFRHFCIDIFIELFCFIPPSLRHYFSKILSFQISEFAKKVNNIPSKCLAKTVLFVSFQPHSRESRLAKCAQLAGFEPLLVYCGKTNFSLDIHFRMHVRVKGYFQLILTTWFFQGPILHIFALHGDLAYNFLRAKTRPTVVDLYDTCSGFVKASNLSKNRERKVIQLADGMIHRDLRVKYLEKLYGYKMPHFNVFISDPLIELQPHPVKLKKENGIHVVSIGWVDEKDNSVLRIATALCQACVHVHVYFNPFQRNRTSSMERYLLLQENSKYFHIEEPVYGNSYWRHLKQYDFGLSVFEPHFFQEEQDSYTIDYLKGCGSSRLMDYINAGLGIIISPSLEFQFFLARRYALTVVEMTHEFLKNPKPILETSLYNKTFNRSRNLKAITIKEASQRLKKFYSKLESVRK